MTPDDSIGRTSWPSARTATLAVLAASVCAGLTVIVRRTLSDTPNDVDGFWALLTFAGCAPLAWWHVRPLVAPIGALLASVLGVLLGYPMTALIVLALGLVGLTASRCPVRVGGLLGLL